MAVSRDILTKRAGQGIRGLIVNSGCANAVTGKGGIEDAIAMCEVTDRYLIGQGQDDGQGLSTIVMSTGVIGQRYNPPPPQGQHIF